MNGKGAISFTITAPTQGRTEEDYWTDYDLPSITKITVERSEGYSSDPVIVATFDDVTLGGTYTFVDDDETLKVGTEYTYTAYAYNGDIQGNRQNEYVKFGLTPSTPDSPVLTPSEDESSVTVTYKCPKAQYSPDYWSDPVPFPEGVTYTKIVLFQQGASYSDPEVILESHENPQPEQEFSYVDTNVKNGYNNYYVRVYCNFGESSYSSNRIFLGEDYPCKPSSIDAQLKEDGTVLITWTEPEKGYNDGHLDKSKLEYAVYRTEQYGSNPQLIAEHIKECQYVDDFADLTAERIVYYRVQPSVEGVETPQYTYNYIETSTGLVAGPAAPVPFTESFNNCTNKYNKNYDRLWVSNFDYASFSDYYIRNDVTIEIGGQYYYLKAGVQGGTDEDELGADAFFYVTPSRWYQDLNPGTLTSGSISLANATNPVFSFYYVPINDNSGKISVLVNKGEFDAEGNELWDEVYELSCDDPNAEPGVLTTQFNWTKVDVPFSAYAGEEKVKVRFQFQFATVENRNAMVIDEIRMDDYPAVTGLSADAEGEDGIKLTWSLPESAGDKSVEYNVYLGEQKVATVETPEYVYTGSEQGESYNFSVEAVYKDHNITSPKCEAVEYIVPVTWFVASEIKYSVDGDNVSAREFQGEGDELLIPASVEYKGKQYNVVSVAPEMVRGNDMLKSVVVEAALETIPENFAYGCTALESVTFPEALTEIGTKAFFGCVALGNPELPASLVKIDASAFEHCEAITELSFGENLEEIGSAAFKGCKNLAKVTFTTAVPPTVAADAFEGIAESCNGSCPEGSIEAYESVEGLNPIDFSLTAVAGVNIDGAVAVEYYTLDGHRVAAPVQGNVTIAKVKYADGKVRTLKVTVK